MGERIGLIDDFENAILAPDRTTPEGRGRTNSARFALYARIRELEVENERLRGRAKIEGVSDD